MESKTDSHGSLNEDFDSESDADSLNNFGKQNLLVQRELVTLNCRIDRECGIIVEGEISPKF